MLHKRSKKQDFWLIYSLFYDQLLEDSPMFLSRQITLISILSSKTEFSFSQTPCLNFSSFLCSLKTLNYGLMQQSQISNVFLNEWVLFSLLQFIYLYVNEAVFFFNCSIHRCQALELPMLLKEGSFPDYIPNLLNEAMKVYSWHFR